MAGQALAASSSQAWAGMGSQAETALNSGWILDQTITSTGGFNTAAAPSTATAFLSSGDGTTGSGNGFWALGRPTKVVHTGGTAYAQVTAASYGAPVTTVTLGLYPSRWHHLALYDRSHLCCGWADVLRADRELASELD